MISFSKTWFLPHIFFHSTVQKITENVWEKSSFRKTDHGLLCTPDSVYCFFEFISYTFPREGVYYLISSSTGRWSLQAAVDCFSKELSSPQISQKHYYSSYNNRHDDWNSSINTYENTSLGCTNPLTILNHDRIKEDGVGSSKNKGD